MSILKLNVFGRPISVVLGSEAMLRIESCTAGRRSARRLTSGADPARKTAQPSLGFLSRERPVRHLKGWRQIMPSGPGGPFHAGEIEAQRRAGVRSEAEEVGRIVRGVLPANAGRVLGEFQVAIAASLGAAGDVWASLVTGPRGFLQAIDERLVLLDAAIRSDDPLAGNLDGRPELGVLAIDFATRRRIRLNGRAMLDAERRIFLSIEQVYGNCPKYIQARRLEAIGQRMAAATIDRRTELDPRQQSIVAAADTFFIASHHAGGGADASHRGGRPGFVQVLGPRLLSFADYPGNNMFNTLGNLLVQPRAGLLFLDFERGDTLQLSGRATVEWKQGSAAVGFEIDEVRETAGAGVRGHLVEYSPLNP
jgi:predicted pyridoxine 5'-phosphate oxidase superfamily flavin-nucleotide-binding protein